MMLEDLYRLLRRSHVQSQGVVDTLTVPLLVLDDRFRVLTANNAFIQTFKVARDDVLDQPLFSLGNGQWDIEDLKLLFEAILPKSAGVTGYEVTHDFASIGKRTFLVDARRLIHPDNNSMNILAQFEDVTDRKRSDAEKDFVIAETSHRVKNVFSVVQAIIQQTEVENRTAEQYRETLLGRIKAAKTAQDLSLGVETAKIGDLIERTVRPAGLDRFRFTADADVELPRSRVLPFSMIIHELTTNALKYGALSIAAGTVSVGWKTEAGAGGKTFLVCEWREQDGPPCRAPETHGYGTSLITGTSKHLGGATDLEFAPEGLRAIVRVPV